MMVDSVFHLTERNLVIRPSVSDPPPHDVI